MTRSILFTAALLFFVPAFTGCGGGGENTIVTGNDPVAIEAEEKQAEEQEYRGEEPGGEVAPRTNDP